MGKQKNAQIARLRQNLMTEKVFSVTFNKFFDITESDYAFRMEGRWSNNPAILALLKTSMSVYFQKKETEIELKDLRMIDNSKENLFHGSGFVFGHIFTFFYFSDLDKGMLGLAKTGSPENTIMRITTKAIRTMNTDNINPN